MAEDEEDYGIDPEEELGAGEGLDGDIEGLDSEDYDDDTAKKKLSGKKIVIFLILPLFLLVVGGGALYFSGMLDSVLGKDKQVVGEVAEGAEEGGEGYEFSDQPGFFHEIPDIIVNLNSNGRQQRFLKLSVTLELETQKGVEKIEEIMPRVNDHLQTYLRELRIADLQGSSGIYRLRQELLDRVRAAAYPVKVKDVLFGEILVQ